jgi:phenylacetate-CoA ligase
MEAKNNISAADTLIKEVSAIKKTLVKNAENGKSKEAELIKKIISDAELKPSSIEEVLKMGRFYDKIKAVEKETGKAFHEVDYTMQDALILRRLQQMTNSLFLNSFWKKRFNEAGITQAPLNFEEWQNIPITDKETMVAAFSGKREGLVVPFSAGGFEIVASGGTATGIPLETVYGLQELQETYEIAGKFMGNFIIDNYFKSNRPKWVATTLSDCQMWSSGTMVGGVLQKIPNTNFLGAGSLGQKVFNHMMSYKGDKVIVSTSSGIALLADYAKELTEDQRNSLRLAMYGSGLMSKKQEDVLKEVYPQINILSYFAATQAETIGLQLNEVSKTLSAVPGLHFIEIVDENGKWVKEGDEGELVITRLHANRAPNIRYRLGDRMVRLKRKNITKLKTNQFLFSGRSGDIIHLGDSQFSAIKVKDALFSYLKKEALDLENQALEIQFLNDRSKRVLIFLVSALDPDKLNKTIVNQGQEKINDLFMHALVNALSLFNTSEANNEYIEKSNYQFQLKIVSKDAVEIYKTPLGKIPLIKDQF